MKVAIIHYWLVGMRGGESVIEQIAELFPEADIFTHVCDPDRISPALRRHRIIETSVARLPQARRHYQKYLMFMPRALEELDLQAYDLVISSESGPAKGVIVRPGALHVCYCHSPMRYIWDMYTPYSKGLGRVARLIFAHVAHRLRIWDVTSAARVDHFIANSRFVAQRIEKYYRRDATVLNPPVDLGHYRPLEDGSVGDHYLFVSELVPYKRVDLAVEAFRRLGRPLKIVGAGPELEVQRRNAPGNVEFLGRVSTEDLTRLYQTCRALVFPAEEDFGIVPLEAMACGRPVIAFGRGGALDSVDPGVTGLFFDSQTPESLVDAVERFERALEPTLDPARIAAHARGFGSDHFRRKFLGILRAAGPDLDLPQDPGPPPASGGT